MSFYYDVTQATYNIRNATADVIGDNMDLK